MEGVPDAETWTVYPDPPRMPGTENVPVATRP
jgi:hypothetical protein